MSRALTSHQTQTVPPAPDTTADALHDVVNVLLVIGAECELAVREVPPVHPARAHLDNVEYLTERASAITKGLLLLNTGPAGPRVSQLPLRRLTATCAASIRDMLRLPVQIAEHDRHLDELMVNVDEIRFRTGICVLAFCVLDGLPPGYPRSLSIRPSAQAAVRSGPCVELEIGANARETANDCPERSETRTRQDESANRGLGLSLAREIISRQGGEVLGRSTDSGTRFLVRLPFGS